MENQTPVYRLKTGCSRSLNYESIARKYHVQVIFYTACSVSLDVIYTGMISVLQNGRAGGDRTHDRHTLCVRN